MLPSCVTRKLQLVRCLNLALSSSPMRPPVPSVARQPLRFAHLPLQICTFVFNNFQDAPPATPFLSSICIVAGGWPPPASLHEPLVGPAGSHESLSPLFATLARPPGVCNENDRLRTGHGPGFLYFITSLPLYVNSRQKISSRQRWQAAGRADGRPERGRKSRRRRARETCGRDPIR